MPEASWPARRTGSEPESDQRRNEGQIRGDEADMVRANEQPEVAFAPATAPNRPCAGAATAAVVGIASATSPTAVSVPGFRGPATSTHAEETTSNA